MLWRAIRRSCGKKWGNGVGMKGAGGGVCQRLEEPQLRLLRSSMLDPNQPTNPQQTHHSTPRLASSDY